VQPTGSSDAAPSGGINPRIVVAVFVIFILQNTESVNIDFLFFDFSAPLWLVLVIVAVLGGLLDDLVVRAVRRKPKKPA
jgi:uncharacterized integral membrane protein